MDGSLGSRTAALLEPYADDPTNSGLPQYDQDELTKMTKERVNAGFQIGFHAIGDKGVQMALNAFAAATPDHVATTDRVGTGLRPVQAERSSAVPSPASVPDLRFRIEHAQVTNSQEIAKFKELKVIASMQPNHVLTDMNWAEARLGPKRAAYSYAWASFSKKGVVLAFGTDYPVEPVAPFRGLYAAVTRKSEDGKKEYYPEQKLNMEQAIAAYTTGSAFAEFAEKEQRHAGSRHAGRSRRTGYGHHFRASGKDSGHEGVAHGGRRQDGLPSQVENPSRTRGDSCLGGPAQPS